MIQKVSKCDLRDGSICLGSLIGCDRRMIRMRDSVDSEVCLEGIVLDTFREY
jgi:hypothetical protein